jgi:hypothetical protein
MFVPCVVSDVGVLKVVPLCHHFNLWHPFAAQLFAKCAPVMPCAIGGGNKFPVAVSSWRSGRRMFAAMAKAACLADKFCQVESSNSRLLARPFSFESKSRLLK